MSDLNNLNNTIRQSLIGGVVCGAGALVGGLIGGPIGIGVGSVIGGTIGSQMFGFRSAPDVIQNDFTEAEQLSLLERARRAMTNSKELLIDLVLDLLQMLLKCRTRQDIADALGPFIQKGLLYIIRSAIRFLTC